jgi:acylphosphatase
MKTERRRVIFSGRVQGVGFRYQTTQVAARFDVVGWVANRDDGTVELVAEGTGRELLAFLNELRTTMSGFIRHEELHSGAATGEFKRFEIRR